MPPGYPGKHHESGTATRGIIQPPCTASSLCIFPKEPHPPQNRGDGVSTYLALTFGTLLSSQGTDASFKTIPGFSGRFPSMFPTLPDLIRTVLPVRISFQWPLKSLASHSGGGFV